MDIKDLLQYEKMVKFDLPESEREWIIEQANMLEKASKHYQALTQTKQSH